MPSLRARLAAALVLASLAIAVSQLGAQDADPPLDRHRYRSDNHLQDIARSEQRAGPEHRDGLEWPGGVYDLIAFRWNP